MCRGRHMSARTRTGPRAGKQALRVPPCGPIIEAGRRMKGVVAVVVRVGAASGVARAQDRIALDEIVGSWQGDDEIQYVELRMLQGGQEMLANRAAIIFDDASASEAG